MSKDDIEYVRKHRGASEAVSRLAVACHPNAPGTALYHARVAKQGRDKTFACCRRSVK